VVAAKPTEKLIIRANTSVIFCRWRTEEKSYKIKYLLQIIISTSWALKDNHESVEGKTDKIKNWHNSKTTFERVFLQDNKNKISKIYDWMNFAYSSKNGKINKHINATGDHSWQKRRNYPGSCYFADHTLIKHLKLEIIKCLLIKTSIGSRHCLS
jgi:hypothetical protein